MTRPWEDLAAAELAAVLAKRERAQPESPRKGLQAARVSRQQH
jgi:hypothetical protein